MSNKKSNLIIKNHKDDIIKDYLDKMSSKEVATKYDISSSIVTRLINRNGLYCRPIKGSRHKTRKANVTLNMFISKEGTPEFDYFIGILATD